MGVYEKSPKTKTSVRDIPIPTELLEELKEYREWFRLADDNFDNKLDQYYLAVGIDRQPLYPQTIGNILMKIEQKNGLKLVSYHGLRHTYILFVATIKKRTYSNHI